MVHCLGFSSFTPCRLNRPHRRHSISWGLAVDKVILAQDITLSKLEDNRLQELDREMGVVEEGGGGHEGWMAVYERAEVLQFKGKAFIISPLGCGTN